MRPRRQSPTRSQTPTERRVNARTRRARSANGTTASSTSRRSHAAAERWRDRARRAEAELSELRTRQIAGDPASAPRDVAEAFEAEIVSEVGPEPQERNFRDWYA